MRKKSDKKMDKLFNLYITQDFHSMLKELKWEMKMDVSDIFRKGAIEYLKSNLSKDQLKKYKDIIEEELKRKK